MKDHEEAIGTNANIVVFNKVSYGLFKIGFSGLISDINETFIDFNFKDLVGNKRNIEIKE